MPRSSSIMGSSMDRFEAVISLKNCQPGPCPINGIETIASVPSLLQTHPSIAVQLSVVFHYPFKVNDNYWRVVITSDASIDGCSRRSR